MEGVLAMWQHDLDWAVGSGYVNLDIDPVVHDTPITRQSAQEFLRDMTSHRAGP